MLHRDEQVFVQAFLPAFAVDAFDVGIPLRRLSLERRQVRPGALTAHYQATGISIHGASSKVLAKALSALFKREES
jgi:hypothetical protein